MSRILYLEDEGWQVQPVILFMERELGHNVKLSTTKEEAIYELSINKYDAVIMDVMMDPEKPIDFKNNGLQVAKMIMEGTFKKTGNGPSLPIIIATGIQEASMKESNEKSWVVKDYISKLGISEKSLLTKPFLDTELNEILQRVLYTGINKWEQ